MQKNNFSVDLFKLDDPAKLLTWVPKTPMSFKKILWPNNTKKNYTDSKSKKIAFLGLTDCDAEALNIFLEQFKSTDFLPKRSQILILTCECRPDKNCFCLSLNKKRFCSSDIHLQENGKSFEIFGLSKTGNKILADCGIEKSDKNIAIKPIKIETIDTLDKKEIAINIDKTSGKDDFWQKISQQCFGCGACTSVCPLCFCFEEKTVNNIDGSCDQLHCWDSCHSQNFSTISSAHNKQNTKSDRFYNWFHHKFCRNYDKNGDFLCTGCGRCITNCVGDLNQLKILEAIQNQQETDEQK